MQGVISATLATHKVDTIDAGNWWELGAIVNTPRAAVNNGAIVSLARPSAWTVTGTSYLTSLTVDASSSGRAPGRSALRMTVDGVATRPVSGNTYSGTIVLSVN